MSMEKVLNLSPIDRTPRGFVYIYLLWVEESTLQVTHVVRYTVLGVPLNRDSGFKRNHQNSVLEDPKFLNCDWVPINS